MKKNRDEVFTIRMTRALEDNAFATGITIYEMMEEAGKVIAEEVSSFLRKANKKSVNILSGFGNNGGDGLVAAKYLHEEGYKCSIILVGNKEHFNSKASQKNYEKLQNILQKDNWKRIRKKESISKVLGEIKSDEILLDALLGIGIKGSLREPVKSVISHLNESFKGKIVSVDLPSGYDPEVKNELMLKNISKIICLGRNKIQKGDFKNSDIVTRNIGIPEECEKNVGIGDIKWYFPERKKDSHKRQNGVVTALAGSVDYIGAPALIALGALRTGADLIFIVTPSNIRQTVSSFHPDFITIPASENEIQPKDVENIFSHPRLQDVSYVVGPGMMNTNTTSKTLMKFLENETQRKVVIDASALSMMNESHLELLKNHSVILTPHKGEFAKVFDTMLDNNMEKNIEIISNLAKKWDTTILVKGKFDIISNGKKTKINKTGHAGMTVGGTGDVLTGIIGAIFAVEEDPFISASLGAYISGKAGEMAATRYGNGLIASDIPEWINYVIENSKSFRAKEV